MNVSEKFFTCSCHTEALLISKFDDEDEVYVSIWTQAYAAASPQYTWRHKLKHIWAILRTGTPHTDQIVLDKAATVELRDYLNTLIK